MVLTDREIRKLCSEENKMISPFSEDALQSESYDLTIGNTIAEFRKEVQCIELDNQDMIDRMYRQINLTNSGYILSPKQYILVSLKETINLPDNITAHIRPRTRFTRIGVIVSAQHCNSTYSGDLRLGLYNASDYAIKIIPNSKVAQIVFEELKSAPTEEKQYRNKKNAAYYNEKEFRGARFEDEYADTIEEMANIVLGRNE